MPGRSASAPPTRSVPAKGASSSATATTTASAGTIARRVSRPRPATRISQAADTGRPTRIVPRLNVAISAAAQVANAAQPARRTARGRAATERPDPPAAGVPSAGDPASAACGPAAVRPPPPVRAYTHPEAIPTTTRPNTSARLLGEL
ncbi:MAG: hypothetical protein U0470_07790 [Anaerolineae bacterium]